MVTTHSLSLKKVWDLKLLVQKGDVTYSKRSLETGQRSQPTPHNKSQGCRITFDIQNYRSLTIFEFQSEVGAVRELPRAKVPNCLWIRRRNHGERLYVRLSLVSSHIKGNRSVFTFPNRIRATLINTNCTNLTFFN